MCSILWVGVFDFEAGVFGVDFVVGELFACVIVLFLIFGLKDENRKSRPILGQFGADFEKCQSILPSFRQSWGRKLEKNGRKF